MPVEPTINEVTVDHETRTHLVREALTMALYLSIVLGAVLAGGEDNHSNQVRLLWGTGVGLGVAHTFAFRLAAGFTRPNSKTTRDDKLVVGSIVAAVALVCGIASIPFLLRDDTVEAVDIASYLMLALVGGTALVSYLRAGRSGRRALIFAGSAMAAAAAIVVLKNALAH